MPGFGCNKSSHWILALMIASCALRSRPHTLEQSSHTSRPQRRQWWRRRSHVNSARHSEHSFDVASDAHTGACAASPAPPSSSPTAFAPFSASDDSSATPERDEMSDEKKPVPPPDAGFTDWRRAEAAEATVARRDCSQAALSAALGA
jgi:hypothetical protein